MAKNLGERAFASIVTAITYCFYSYNHQQHTHKSVRFHSNHNMTKGRPLSLQVRFHIPSLILMFFFSPEILRYISHFLVEHVAHDFSLFFFLFKLIYLILLPPSFQFFEITQLNGNHTCNYKMELLLELNMKKPCSVDPLLKSRCDMLKLRPF